MWKLQFLKVLNGKLRVGFEITHFWVYFQSKVKFKVENCVKQYKNNKKKYCEATLNVFFNDKKI